MHPGRPRQRPAFIRAIYTPSPAPAARRAATAVKAARPAPARAARRAGCAATGAAATLHRVLEPKITKPRRSVKPLTLPEEVELATGRRAAVAGSSGGQVGGRRARLGAGREKSSRGSSALCQPAMARRGAGSIAYPNAGSLVPALPPCLFCSRQAGPGPSPFKSLAQRVAEFQKKTPPRFRTAPRGGGAGVAPATVARALPTGASGWQPHQPQITDAKVGGARALGMFVWLAGASRRLLAASRCADAFQGRCSD
jgi:hypothetical protein